MKFLLYITALAAAVTAPPIPATSGHDFLWVRCGKEGDLVLTEEQERAIMDRNGIMNVTFRWPNKTIPYKIQKGHFGDRYERYKRMVLELINDYSCVTVREAKEGETDYVLLTSDAPGCWSSAGYNPYKQPQQLNLEGLCVEANTIHHEFMHVAGFFHQHSAQNRDEYVRILWENIEPGFENQFQKIDGETTDFGVGYDLESLMHYFEYTFNKNGKRTIEAIHNPSMHLGSFTGMTAKDKLKLNRMYNC